MEPTMSKGSVMTESDLHHAPAVLGRPRTRRVLAVMALPLFAIRWVLVMLAVIVWLIVVPVVAGIFAPWRDDTD